MDPFDLRGRRVVVTGVSQGIGRAIALALGRAGARVAGVHLGADATDIDAAASLRVALDALGADHLIVAGDTGIAATHDRLADATMQRWGGIDVWINNAARLMVKPFVDMTDADWHGLLAANMHGYFYGCRAAARAMVAAGDGGRIVNTTSAADVLVVAELSAYIAAKGAIVAMTKELAVELGPKGITVNAIGPGATDTPLNARAYTEDVRSTYCARIPLGRIATPEEIADAALFFCSDASRYVTGQELLVDGGLSINGNVGHRHT